MDLSREISLSSLFKKKDKAKKGGKAQLKTYINFAEIEEKKDTNWALAIPGIIIILALAFILGKFGVADRFATLSKKQSEAAALQARLDEDMAIISGGTELSDRYYHYTWSDMTDDELNQISRVDAAQLVDFIVSNGVEVRSFSLKEKKISAEISADSLQSISKLTGELEQQDIVASCSMTTAQTNEVQISSSPARGGSLGEESENGEAEGAEGITDDEPMMATAASVDAQLNIYLKDNTEAEQP